MLDLLVNQLFLDHGEFCHQGPAWAEAQLSPRMLPKFAKRTIPCRRYLYAAHIRAFLEMLDLDTALCDFWLLVNTLHHHEYHQFYSMARRSLAFN